LVINHGFAEQRNSDDSQTRGVYSLSHWRRPSLPCSALLVGVMPFEEKCADENNGRGCV